MRIILIFSSIFICLHTFSQDVSKGSMPVGKKQVLLLGCFHFDNPGLDVVKVNDANMLSPARQQQVQQVLDKLAQWKPDKIFVEIPASMQGRLDTAYQKYLNGAYELKASETHQLGFRLGKMLGHTRLYGIDDRSTDFPMDSVMKVMMAAGQMGQMMHFKKAVDSMQSAFNNMLETKTLTEILLEQNNRHNRDFQVASYFNFLQAGPMDNSAGAHLVSQWWKRNMIIYGNLLKQLNSSSEKVLVIFGAGHTALLEAMMRYHTQIDLVEPWQVL